MEDWKNNFLEVYRKQIDTVDREILFLIKRRMQLAKKIAQYKKQNNMPIFSAQRETEIYSRVTLKAHEMGISESFARNIFQLFIEESKKFQKDYLDKKYPRKSREI